MPKRLLAVLLLAATCWPPGAALEGLNPLDPICLAGRPRVRECVALAQAGHYWRFLWDGCCMQLRKHCRPELSCKVALLCPLIIAPCRPAG